MTRTNRLPAPIAGTVHTGAESLLDLVLGLGLGQDIALAVDPPIVIHKEKWPLPQFSFGITIQYPRLS